MLAPLVKPDLALLVSSEVLGCLGGSRFDFLYRELSSDVVTVDNPATNLVSFDAFVIMLLQGLEMQDVILVAFPLGGELLLEAGLASNT